MSLSTTRKLDAARRVARQLHDDFELHGTLLAGSLTAGLGNEHSDADVYAVLVEGAQVPATRQIVVGEDRVDVEWYSLADLAARVRRLVDFEIRSDGLALMWSLENDFDVVSRIATSDVVTEDGEVARAIGPVVEAEPSLRRLYAARWSLGINGSLEDFRGAVSAQDLDSCVLLGQAMVVAAGKALAAAEGDLYFGRKWVYAQLSRSAATSGLLDVFRSQQTGAWAAKGLDGASELVAFCQRVAAVAQLRAAGLTVPVEHLCRPVASHRRGPEAVLVGLSNGKYLVHEELGRQFVVGAAAATLWALADGFATIDELTGAVAVVLDVPDQVADLAHLAHRLGDQGLLSGAEQGVSV